MQNFKQIEYKWQKAWEKSNIFKTVCDSKKKKYYVLEMFPYPSASYLHMGHVRNYTIGDAIARYKRMSGFNVLYPMGYDSFGLPAENAAKKENIHPREYTNKAIAKIMEYQKALGNSYDWSRVIATHEPEYYRWNQFFFLKFLEKGLVYRKKDPVNWCNECNSTLANEEVVNGNCWRHETTSIIQRELEQWFLKTTAYADELLTDIEGLGWSDRIKALQRNWIGKSEGTLAKFKLKDSNDFLEIFTTRIDTIFSVTFLVMAPEHPKALEFIKGTKYEKSGLEFIKKISSASKDDEKSKEGFFTGKYVINPANGKDIPVWLANFVLMDYGTGVVMANAHDQRDFDFAKKYDIPLIQVLKPKESKYLIIEKSIKGDVESQLKNFGNVVVESIGKNWGKFFRVTVDYKKEKDFIKYLENNLLTTSEDGGAWYADSIGTTNIVVFPKKHFTIFNKEDLEEFKKYGRKLGIPEKQLSIDLNKEIKAFEDFGILCNSDQFDGLTSEEAIPKIREWLEKKKLGKKVTQYKLRDWLISRQRYWGTPIPIVYCNKCGAVPLSEKDLPLQLPEKADFKSGGNPLNHDKDWVNVKCPKCKSNAKRETDTMGGFVDSSWYFLRYCSPNDSKNAFERKETEYWMPVDQYIGGIEHAVGHLIYSRFFTKCLRDLKMLNINEPFTRLFNQGVLYKEGHKMSKSFGNIVTQTEISEKYGIDTARLFLMSVASPEADMEWNDKGIEGSFRFLQRVSRISELKFIKDEPKDSHKLNLAIKNYSDLIDKFKFNLAVIELMKYSEYLESRPIKLGYESLLKMLSIFAPHTCEELWSNIGNKSFVSVQSWPVFDSKRINPEIELSEKLVMNVSNDIRYLVNILKISKPKKVTLIVSSEWKYALFEKVIFLLNKNMNPSEIIKELMKSDLKKYGQEVVKLIPKIVEKRPDFVLSKSRELKLFNDNVSLIKEEFDCDVIVEDEDKFKHDKSKFALPGKPALIIQ